jgi:hypothetical protein
MTSTSDPIILSSDVVDKLPRFYRAMALYFAESGRVIITTPSGKADAPK